MYIIKVVFLFMQSEPMYFPLCPLNLQGCRVGWMHSRL